MFVAEQFVYLFIGIKTECAQKYGYGNFAVFIYTHKESVGCVCFILQPRSAVRNNRCGIKAFAALIVGSFIIYTGGTYYLAYDYALRTVYNKGAAVGHHGEIAHVDLLFLNFACCLVGKTNSNLKRNCVVYVPILTFFDREFGSIA